MPDITPFEALALSLHHNRGAYALLVGSGLSRSAGIPTGWDITLALISRLAAVKGVADLAKPEEWFREQYQKVPSYSEVLDAMGATQAERRAILHGFIDPKEGDDARRPTPAHRAIAKLVAVGAVKVIITTNFDRLLENALREEGVEPTVVASDDAVIGATPLVHSPCTVIKVHGDYHDARIKNTDAELGSYAKPVDDLLDYIFDNFGLLVAGWSGDWDVALRSAILRAPSRRYALYWAARGAPSTLAHDIIRQRAGRVIQITDADSFFRRLIEALAALEQIDRPHPASAALAIALVKKYCRDDAYAMELTELLMSEVDQIRAFVLGLESTPRGLANEEVQGFVESIVARSEVLRRMALISAHWGTPQATQAVVRAISHLASWPVDSGMTRWLELRPLGATLCFYSALLGLIARESYGPVRHLLHAKGKSTANGEGELVELLPPQVLTSDAHFPWKILKGYERFVLPGSEYLFHVLQGDALHITLTSAETEELFDRLEYLVTLEFAHQRIARDRHFWFPTGRYASRRVLERQRAWIKAVAADLARAGLFGGKEATVAEVEKSVAEEIGSHRW